MSKSKSQNIKKYNEKFIKSISIKNIRDSKELKELLDKLEIASSEITSYYKDLYEDYILELECENTGLPEELSIANMKRLKRLTKQIQRARNYLLFMYTFENPFKSNVRG